MGLTVSGYGQRLYAVRDTHIRQAVANEAGVLVNRACFIDQAFAHGLVIPVTEIIWLGEQPPGLQLVNQARVLFLITFLKGDVDIPDVEFVVCQPGDEQVMIG